MRRNCGILLAISSLPSSYGIGDFGKEAYRFVDFLFSSGQNLWQILPLGPLEYGNSPYQAPSTFAGNFLYLDLEEFIKAHYISREDIASLETGVHSVQYEIIKSQKEPVLRKASRAFFAKGNEEKELKIFQKENEFWLRDYALFLFLKEKFSGKPWMEWPKEYRYRKETTLEKIRIEAEERYQYESFLQYYFWKQWLRLRNYANEKGIKIIGDLPIFVSSDSSDTWQHPELFQFDKRLKIKAVAGCPPDYFSKTGQLWGNVVYDWVAMKKEHYAWWIARVRYHFSMYDILRLDHFRGFASYWSIRYGEKTAMYGSWKKGPRYPFFQALEKRIPKLDIIAEDLGTLTPDVFRLLEQTKYSRMKVLQFGLTEWDSMYQPRHYEENSVAYTGTHDNMPIIQWYESLTQEQKKICDESLTQYLEACEGNIWEPIQWRAIETLYASKSKQVIIPLQDILGLGKDSRMNIPSTVGNNWSWRVYANYTHPDLENKLYYFAKKYGRNTREEQNGIG